MLARPCASVGRKSRRACHSEPSPSEGDQRAPGGTTAACPKLIWTMARISPFFSGFSDLFQDVGIAFDLLANPLDQGGTHHRVSSLPLPAKGSVLVQVAEGASGATTAATAATATTLSTITTTNTTPTATITAITTTTIV